MTDPTKIEALYKYPVKSLPGILVQSMGFSSQGPNDDRRYTLVDERGVFISQRTQPKLALLSTELQHGDVLVRNLQNTTEVTLREDEEQGAPVEIRIHDETCLGYYLPRPAADQFFSDYLGKKCRVVRHYSGTPRVRKGKRTGLPVRVRFADGYPITVLTWAAVEHLNLRMVQAGHHSVGVTRFRPNILVSGPAHDEDTWLFAKHGGLTLRFEKWCSRCSVPDVDPKTGILNRKHPVKNMLDSYRMINPETKDNYFSSNFAVEINDADGARLLQVGDTLEIIRQEKKAA